MESLSQRIRSLVAGWCFRRRVERNTCCLRGGVSCGLVVEFFWIYCLQVFVSNRTHMF